MHIACSYVLNMDALSSDSCKARLTHTQGPQAGQLPGAPMGDLGAFAPDPQQHLPQQQQQYQAQLQALAQKAHELAPAVPDGSAWEFDGALATCPCDSIFLTPCAEKPWSALDLPHRRT